MTPQALKTWRHRHNYTQSGLAAALGISLSMIQKYEAGNYPIPRRVVLALIALENPLLN